MKLAAEEEDDSASNGGGDMFKVCFMRIGKSSFVDWHKFPSPLGSGIDDTEHLGPPRFGEQFPRQSRADCRIVIVRADVGPRGKKNRKEKSLQLRVEAGSSSQLSREGFSQKTQGAPPTGLLLLQRQVVPAALHAVTQSHPQVGLLLERHSLPAFFDVGQGRVGERLAGHGPGRSQSGALRQGIAS